MAIGGGGFITGIAFHPHERHLIYARTDVGGAYRWEESGMSWVALTDWIGPDDVNLTGVESLALDPEDTNKVYLAVGTYEVGPAAILRSSDRGKTFLRVDVPFRMGANEAGRFNGERLAVDPNLGSILYFGSRTAGLWRSGDGAATWRKVDTFHGMAADPSDGATGNTRARFGEQPVGIVSVAFDAASGSPGKATPVIYAAVSTTQTNLFCSRDGGASWQPVAGQPVGLRPNHLVWSRDGRLYVTYGLEPGPNTMTSGAVWRFNIGDGSWTDISPEKAGDQPFGYGAVDVCSAQPETIMVTTFDHWKPHDAIYRSTDRGASWQPIWNDDTQWDPSSAPYTRSRKPHWMGALAIDPTDSGRALFGTGYGIWAATNLAFDGPAQWCFFDRGLEETVPLALISPPAGAHLISGVGDIDGFVHENLSQSPEQGSFAGPRFSNTEDLAFAGRRPEIIVRVGTSREQILPAALSRDGGLSWTALGGEPAPHSAAGTVAISADGETIIWTPRRGRASYSVNAGTNWAPCAGLQPGIRVVADRLNPACFYAYDPRADRSFVSTNGGARFGIASLAHVAEAPVGPDAWREGSALSATPDEEGDLWLALRDRGLYHSTDGGAHFTRLGEVERAVSLGFGKPAPGKDYPALFLAGRLHSVTGLYRSEDGGRTWIRINDDAHQFGWVDHVTGDPRIFGRVYFGTGGRGVIYGDLKAGTASR